MAKTHNNPIIIKNARVHNLKNLSVEFKRNKLTVVTGVSGSGKSTLVFDTLYAEGQRRYVESLSSYARQFMGRMNKPDVDYIKGISPAVAIEQKVNTRNPRSTVATSTEIYDYLKLLFARVGHTFSPTTKKEVKMHTIDDVMLQINEMEDSSKLYLLVEIKATERGLLKEMEVLLQKGFTRVILNEEIYNIEETIADHKAFDKQAAKQKLYLLIDRFVSDKNDEELQTRMADSIQTAFAEGHGECTLMLTGEQKVLYSFSNKFEADGQLFETPTPHFFAFNNPYGACKRCEGFGSVLGIDPDLVIPNKILSVFEDAIAPWRGEKMSEWKTHFIALSRKNDFPIHRSYSELNQEEIDFLWHGGKNWEGIDGFFTDIEKQTYKIQYRVMLSRYRGRQTCPDCKGTRLRKDTAYVRLVDAKNYTKINTKNFDPFTQLLALHDVLLMSVDKAKDFFANFILNEYEEKVANRILKEIRNRLLYLSDVGLGYLSLNRLSNTLSGGESQRINLATSLGSSLVGAMYILDEPSIGLHSRDTQRLIIVLKHLRDLGNTVIVVEHDEEVMEASDELVDIGPFAGRDGGELIFQGTLKEALTHKESLTGQYLSGREQIEIPKRRRKWTHYIEVQGARENNLKNLNVKFPLNALTMVTGVSGSGKTTLVKGVLYPALQKEIGGYFGEQTGKLDKLDGNIKNIKSVEMIDQNPIGKSSRSNPVTYIKAYDAIRELYANQTLSKASIFKPSHFSFNVEGGRCDTCQGEGETTIEMQFMADIKLPCDDCKGMRFKNEVLEVLYNNKSIGEILNITVDEAMQLFAAEKSIIDKLKPLQDVGLGYVKLGQSASTLSGGEAQRVKLASFLGKGGQSDNHILFIFDEPTTGLHFHDIKKLLNSFNALLDKGHSIIVIEHNLEMIKCADWVIDLGPEAGDIGGNLVFEGTPEDLVKVKSSYTGQYLKEKL